MKNIIKLFLLKYIFILCASSSVYSANNLSEDEEKFVAGLLQANLDEIKEAVKSGVNIEKSFTFGDGYTYAPPITLIYYHESDEYGRLSEYINEEKAFEITSYLVSIGAKVNAQDDIGYNALLRAIECGYSTLFNFLIANNADINSRILYQTEEPSVLDSQWTQDAQSFTPVSMAISERQEAMLDVLLEKGASIPVYISADADEPDERHEVDFSMAARLNHEGIVRRLIQYYNEKGIPFHLRFMVDALISAMENENNSIFSVLLEQCNLENILEMNEIIINGLSIELKKNLKYISSFKKNELVDASRYKKHNEEIYLKISLMDELNAFAQELSMENSVNSKKRKRNEVE